MPNTASARARSTPTNRPTDGPCSTAPTGVGHAAHPLRQYLAKGTDLRTFSKADLDAIALEFNHRPRKTHGYRTPAEAYADLLNSSDALTA
jgi:hypothetical protein